MRIALFTDTYYPRINGVATSVLMLKNKFEAMGHDVLIVTTTDPDASLIEENIIRISSIPFRTQRLGAVAGPKITKKIREFAPEIIHTHSEFTLGNLGRAMARKLKVPYVHTMHTVWEFYTEHLIRLDVLEPVLQAAARKYTAMTCNKAYRVIVPTKKVMDLVRSYGVLRKIVVIPTGIELDRFAPEKCDAKQIKDIRAQLGIQDTDKVLINIGRIEKEKNLTELILLFQNYLLANNDVKLVFVGDGTAKKDLEKYAADVGLQDRVIFAGEKPWSEINMYYRIGDVFVGSSISEAQGLTYIEAMASGLPIIAKEDRCLENVLSVGENGYMFTGEESLVAAADSLLCDLEKRRSFSAHASRSAQTFSSQAYAENVLALYKELIK
ncbi:MAG: glycosyltransferase [Oscillospiraceae bacterium]|nr:glycosyltransferase [Oscillospiraceae bacterium]